MNESRINIVEPSRLAWLEWREGKRVDEGDIHASYSGDSIAFQNTVRKPFLWRGEPWVAVSLSGIGGAQEAEAVRLIAAESFEGVTTTYGERCSRERAARAARRDPMGFYHGVRVKHRGLTYVLSGPEESFVAGTPSPFEDGTPAFTPPQSHFFRHPRRELTICPTFPSERKSRMDTVHPVPVDYECSYADGLGRRAAHRVRIFTPGAWTTVLVTDLSEKHHCPSVTNSIEELVDALLVAHPEIRPERLVVIEHYDDRSSWRRIVSWVVPPATHETFDLVSLSRSADGKVSDPNWKRVTKAEAEQWAGAALP
jgi:hypothetical protein